MVDNFERYVLAVREQNEADARYRKRTREERKRNLRNKRIWWCFVGGVIILALIFEAMSRFEPKGETAKESYVSQSSSQRTDEAAIVGDYEDPNEEMLIEQALLAKATKIENCRVTYYCAEPYKHICGYGLGITKSGRELVPHWSCAVDPDVIPLGASVMVDFGDGIIQYYSADDTGGAVKGNHIDICLPTHSECFEQEYNTATVYWLKEGE